VIGNRSPSAIRYPTAPLNQRRAVGAPDRRSFHSRLCAGGACRRSSHGLRMRNRSKSRPSTMDRLLA
jgi:hypothetical protein